MNGPVRARDTMGKGYLTFKIRTAQSALPVEGAKITVTQRNNGGEIVGVLESDRNGNTDRIALSAPAKAESLSPGISGEPFFRYDIRVEAEGFYPSELYGAPVFDSVTSVQTVNMIPLAEYTPEPFGTRIYEDAPDALGGGE